MDMLVSFLHFGTQLVYVLATDVLANTSTTDWVLGRRMRTAFVGVIPYFMGFFFFFGKCVS